MYGAINSSRVHIPIIIEFVSYFLDSLIVEETYKEVYNKLLANSYERSLRDNATMVCS